MVQFDKLLWVCIAGYFLKFSFNGAYLRHVKCCIIRGPPLFIAYLLTCGR